MGRSTGHRDITEILLKAALNTIQTINQLFLSPAPEQEEVIYQRLGPGYSVLDPATVNSHNASLEMFRALAETIEKTLSESMDQVHSCFVFKSFTEQSGGF